MPYREYGTQQGCPKRHILSYDGLHGFLYMGSLYLSMHISLFSAFYDET